MTSTTGRVALSLMMLGLGASAWADTREGYQNSITRQQIERMDENARANAKDSPNMPSSGIQGSALEGQLNRLRAEQQAEQEAKEAARAREAAALEERVARDRIRMREEEIIAREERAKERVREQQQLEQVQARISNYIKSLPANAPITVEHYDRLLDLAMPLTEVIRPLVALAYRDYPQAFALRHAFIQLSTCAGLRTAATESLGKTYVEEQSIRAECKAQQLAAALPYLDQARQTGDSLDRALACALMAGAYAGLSQYEANGMESLDTDVMTPRLGAWLNKRLSPCASQVPPGSPFYVGLVEPMVRDAERTDEGRLRVSQHSLWPLVARASWSGVDINNADAVRRVYEKSAALKKAPPLGAQQGSEYYIWFADFPQVKVLELKPGIDTRESVMAAMGNPATMISRESVGVVPSIRQACRSSIYQNQLANVWRYNGSTSFKRFGSRREMEQVVHVFFDEKGRLCAAEVTRDWIFPGAYAGALGIFVDGPGGWNSPRWKETYHVFR